MYRIFLIRKQYEINVKRMVSRNNTARGCLRFVISMIVNRIIRLILIIQIMHPQDYCIILPWKIIRFVTFVHQFGYIKIFINCIQIKKL